MVSPGHSSTKRLKSCHAADEKKPADGKTRLPGLEVLKILSLDPMRMTCNTEPLRESLQSNHPGLPVPEELMRDLTEGLNQRMGEKLTVLQKWVRREVDEKTYVEVPDEFIGEDGVQMDLLLASRNFTTVVADDGTEKLVLEFKKKEKDASESMPGERTTAMSFSTDAVSELKAALRWGVPGCSNSRGDKSSRAGGKRMTRLRPEDVTEILSRDSASISRFCLESMRKFAQQRRSNVTEGVVRVMAESLAEIKNEKFIPFQRWVRDEFDAKSYVEVPQEFIRHREEARERQGMADLDIPDEYFTTVVEDDGKEKLVFSFAEEGKPAQESMLNECSTCLGSSQS